MTKATSGIVMEIEGRRAIILTSRGQFERIRLGQSAQVGDLIAVGAFSSYGVPRWRFRSAVASVAAIAVLCIGVLHAVLVSPPKAQAYAFVSLDANPSVSLDLSDHNTVLGVDGLNAPGKEIAKSVHVRGVSLNTAIRDIVGQMVAQGLLPSHDTIIVAAASAQGNRDVSRLESQAAADVDAALQAHHTLATSSATVYSIGLPNAVWDDAMKAKVSPGKYATYLLAKQVGIPVQLQDITSSNLQRVLAQVHDMQAGTQQLDSGHYGEVAAIVQQSETTQQH
ncbi:anti-sigma factor domain-containing protein [Alicyclobacillus dauci]|uniref:Anti-sigma factor domain-containing protein n=1 Tax=Alicyclobacillus dauci TaxID=1475485 RepID=A0ABY6Z6L9_9BACL|nr:anti-sigma factor domain-containing protein [Alicyclobacillus dauci]WAH38424.1 anti-sigma factor domain-containing protein [Alicyclobacillus dauci]